MKPIIYISNKRHDYYGTFNTREEAWQYAKKNNLRYFILKQYGRYYLYVRKHLW